MKMPIALTGMILILISLLTGAQAQCCGSTNIDTPYLDDFVDLDEERIFEQDLDINGSVLIESDLLIENSTITMSGKGFILTEGARLMIRNSTFQPKDEGKGYYIDLVGDAEISNTTLRGCLDQENSYFGLYIEVCSVLLDNLTLVDSGRIKVSGGSVNISDSIIGGIISYSGNISMVRTSVEGYGISQIGPGRTELEDITVTTDLPFTSTAGIYSIDADLFKATGIDLNGTFNGGITFVNTPVSLDDISIDLPGGRIAADLTDLNIHSLSGITASGTDYGLFISNCSSTDTISDITIEAGEIGMDLYGNDPFDLEDIIIQGGTTGIIVRAPSMIRNSTLEDNDVAMIIEDGSLTGLKGCDFLNYTYWGIEEETWSPTLWDENTFTGREGNFGSHAWWAWVPIEIYGQGDVRINDAKLMFYSPFGSERIIYGPIVDLIWGYQDVSGRNEDVEYSVKASKGNSVKNTTFSAKEGTTLTVHLQLTDIGIVDIDLIGENLVLELENNGPRANEVEVKVYLDDVEQMSHRTTIGDLTNKTLTIEDLDIPTGEHYINVTIGSQDEYKGGMGAYLGNNEASFFGSTSPVEDDTSNGRGLVLLGCLIIASIFIFLVPILIRRRD